jgi:septum site-determining protein MinC
MTGSFNDDENLGFEADSTPPHGERLPGLGISASPARVEEQEGETRSSVITARGTAEGLVLRLDGRVQEQDLTVAVRDFLESRRSFLQGNDVAFEWVGRKPSDELVHDLTSLLASDFKVSVRSSKLKGTAAKSATPDSGISVFGGQTLSGQTGQGLSNQRQTSQTRGSAPAPERNVSLFDGMDSIESRTSVAANSMLWDEPDTRIIYGTLRSGQKVETEHSIVVFGDVNSGAEVIAGGDIVILGTLRGIAHAGAYDESGGGRVIFSLNLQPTQLRIGLVISRGSGSDNFESTPRGGIAEIARVEGNLIVVEPYQSRTVWARRRE